MLESDSFPGCKSLQTFLENIEKIERKSQQLPKRLLQNLNYKKKKKRKAQC